ncbi:MAG: M23 family metallopeptidase [Chitinophagales bacterium]
MKKEKYYYNLKTLQYEKIKSTWSQRLLKGFGFIAACLVTSFILVMLWNLLFDSPEEKMLKNEMEVMTQQMTYIDKEVDKAYALLDILRERDNNTYRVLYEADPIPDALWESGTGDRSKYAYLSQYSTGDLMEDLNVKLDDLKLKLNWQSKSYDEIADLVLNKEEMLQSIPAIQPVSNEDLKRMASGYGWRTDPVYGVKKFHHGMDFTAPTGTEIYATGKGTAITVNYSNGGYGNRIIIDHGYGYQTLYAHMSGFNLEEGDQVERGDVIGFVGNTGKSVGPHLHYEVIVNGTKVNPVHFYYQDLDAESYEAMLQMSENAGQSLD